MSDEIYNAARHLLGSGFSSDWRLVRVIATIRVGQASQQIPACRKTSTGFHNGTIPNRHVPIKYLDAGQWRPTLVTTQIEFTVPSALSNLELFSIAFTRIVLPCNCMQLAFVGVKIFVVRIFPNGYLKLMPLEATAKRRIFLACPQPGTDSSSS